ncbi:equilibrative nucleobase transporter 1-like [Diadema setosum]|uniref:equilibrative nucleobase transporter 1-like n=1 Tax=Diadema setosum TaxID=31175 RepID=UPI003B3A90C9
MPCSITRTERVVVLVFTMLENLVHTASIYGWPSLVYVLKDLDYYRDLCPPTTDEPANDTQPNSTTMAPTSSPVVCAAQDARLQIIYTISSSMVPCSMLFEGILFERCGQLVCRVIFHISLLVAYLCIAASSPEVPDLLFPGTILLGLGGIFILVSTFEASNLFPSGRAVFIGLLAGAGDSSSCIFLLVKVAYDNGVSMNACFYVLAISTLFFLVNTALLPRSHIPWPLPPNYELRRCCCCFCADGKNDNPVTQDATDAGSMEVEADDSSFTNHNEDKKEPPSENLALENKGFEGDENLDADAKTVTVTAENGAIPIDDVVISKKERKSMDESLAEEKRLLDFPSFWSSCRSPLFILMTIWTISCQGEIFFVIGVMNSWLTWIADGNIEEVSSYTNILAITSIGSVAVSPMFGLLFQRNKIRSNNNGKEAVRGPYADLKDSWLPVALATLTAIAMSCCMMVPSLPVQYGTFFFLMVSRAFFYGASGAIVPITFPMRLYPSIFGMVNFMAGVFSFTQYPLFILIQEELDDDPRWVIAGFLIANVISLSYPAYIYYYTTKKEKMNREDSRSQGEI